MKKDKLIFEGEYLNGEINGKGRKKYNKDCNSYLVYEEYEYEGEYLNGKKHGIGKEYNIEQKLIFQGDYLYIILLLIKSHFFLIIK